jgi:hypothetical protein
MLTVMLLLNLLFIVFIIRRMKDLDLAEGAKRGGSV